MDVAASIRTARTKSMLGLRELARRAGTSHATLLAYESGRIDPSTKVAERILLAAGWRPRVDLEALPMTEHGRPTGEELADILDLAEHLPHRLRARHLEAPVFPHHR